ncbi:hypothetical protein EVAR_51160_1 [Eumeta japonica]|uniref:Uncharacterized protein n=1 Tax=Eumeta variegata TaxID=151549 RepID=A0A4C1XC80_EUMVA|nr:hypothetical protein EVAR_51160_1 [Eumeta japonica]
MAAANDQRKRTNGYGIPNFTIANDTDRGRGELRSAILRPRRTINNAPRHRPLGLSKSTLCSYRSKLLLSAFPVNCSTIRSTLNFRRSLNLLWPFTRRSVRTIDGAIN